jgi:hypothetical protein
MKSHWTGSPSFVQSTYISTYVSRGIRKPLGANDKKSLRPRMAGVLPASGIMPSINQALSLFRLDY